MKVLIVEDEPRIAAEIAVALRAAGFVVDTAVEGEEAWFKGDTEIYDAVILDLGLPRLDVWRCCGDGGPRVGASRFWS